MAALAKSLDAKLAELILDFCRHIAGSCEVKAACVCSDYTYGLATSVTPVEVLLIIRDFQPRLMNYVKTFGKRNIIVIAVDQWVFERDVDRGFLGEALAGSLIFPYTALLNNNYLHLQEVKLKKRLILELLENLVAAFPELSSELYIKPEYFMYETMLRRARLFPPMIYDLLSFMRRDVRKENAERAFKGYSEALKELEKENAIVISDGYIKIREKFVGVAKTRKVRFTNLFRSAQKALFTSLLSTFPRVLNVLSQNRETLLRLQRFGGENSKTVHQIEDPQRYLYVPTANGTVSLADRMDIEVFARKMLSASENTQVKIEEIGGVLNDVYLIRAYVKGEERKVVAKSFKDWTGFKWFPLTLWTVGTRTFAVTGRSRLERDCTINQMLYSKGFAVPKLLHVSHAQRVIFMEYIEGENLEKTVKRIANAKKTAQTGKELSIISKTGETLAKIHALNIALGDTKPENILVGKNDAIYLLDFEQASRNGDKVWDVAEFLYYAGHYIPPFAGVRPAELIAKAFVAGYLKAGGDVKVVKKAGNPKYTKVFSVFTLPHIMFVISNVCRNADKLKG